MGQKTNPSIFQLNKTAKWNSIYIEKKSREHPLYNSRDLEIKKFIIKFFSDRGLTIKNCKLSYFDNSLNVFISYHQQKFKSIKLVRKINKFQKIKFKYKRARRVEYDRYGSKIKNYGIKRNSYYSKKGNNYYNKKGNNYYNKKDNNSSKKHNKKKNKYSNKKSNKYSKKKNKYLKKKSKYKALLSNRLRQMNLANIYSLGIKKPKEFWMSTTKLRKKTLRIIRSVKNYYNYENLSYKKDYTKKATNIEKIKKIKRSKYVHFYKKYLSLKKNKNIKNLSNNNFLSQLFQGLNLFYNKKLLLTLILKPLTNRLSVRKNLDISNKNKLKKNLMLVQKYQQKSFFKEGLNLIFSAVNHKNSAELISKYVATTLKRIKGHNFFLGFISSLLTIFVSRASFKIVSGIKIKVKGRINGSNRARSKIISIGNMPVLTIDSSIKYSESTAYTGNGTMGVKVWVCEKM